MIVTVEIDPVDSSKHGPKMFRNIRHYELLSGRVLYLEEPIHGYLILLEPHQDYRIIEETK